MMNNCLTALLPAPAHVTLAVSPYQISAFKGVELGWDQDKFCFKCSGSGYGSNFYGEQNDIKLS